MESQKRLNKTKVTKETKKERGAISLGVSRIRTFQKEGQMYTPWVSEQ